jgi:hypothetical protein
MEEHGEQQLALRAEQAGIKRVAGRERVDILREQALQEGPGIGTSDAEYGAIWEDMNGHAADLVARAANAKLDFEAAPAHSPRLAALGWSI